MNLKPEWKCFTEVLKLAAIHMPLQGVGHAFYPNK
jgi:preprotein translocase subunit Sss1